VAGGAPAEFRQIVELLRPTQRMPRLGGRNEGTMLDSHFGMPTLFYNGTETCGHAVGSAQSRRQSRPGDGHVEHWRWATAKVPATVAPPPRFCREMPDWNRVAAASNR